MNHSYLWEFNMKMCCSMQISDLREKLESCQRIGITKNHVVRPQYPVAPNEDYLFSSMNLYANMKEDETIELEGIVYYDNIEYKSKSAIIRTFRDLSECLEWISHEEIACEKCVMVLDEKC